MPIPTEIVWQRKAALKGFGDIEADITLNVREFSGH